MVLKYNVVFFKASSYLVYNDSIDVDSLEKEREKELTLICSANVLLACLDRQISPNWDGHNRAALKIVTDLGYI
ncbi:GNAT family N-acetyltransferase [Gilliamella apicola]|uniref:Uncharacterized protein n=2 Tax=Gilliamella apicola TaxID=1196095 RepID=A0A242NEL0_9GAMM|nr:hypothetical protein B5S40_10845 [Gilliamella apicola]OTP84432.1 hypothetical protein B5S44_10430 [Gilliamella apicola]OTP98257.1 hypothetical protein B6D08_11840 [Gilliamella apicola]OTQ14602.1 hypothetical protein B6D11_07445 [Gilliamella apicola]